MRFLVFVKASKDSEAGVMPSRVAARIPGARLGYIDVRQVREIEGLPQSGIIV